jgi:hypothetical protein
MATKNRKIKVDFRTRKYLKILNQGIEVWNEWRSKHPGAIPDLSMADLTSANLCGVDFSHAYLINCNLAHANLCEAYFDFAECTRADFTSANLEKASFLETNLTAAIFAHANLKQTHFFGARLQSTNFGHADLVEANLSYANLTNAVLADANFERAEIQSTIFGDVDLSVAKGLNTLKHFGPSTLGIDTLYRSGGNITETFMRGVGIPESLIVYAHSLTQQSIEFYSCFISYSSKNQNFAERLLADLQNKGVRCWFAPKDLKIGQKIRVGIDESIRIHDKLLVVLSRDSVSSDWVEKEVETAFEQERAQKRIILFPIRLDDAVMRIESGWPADIRRTRNIGDFRHWKNHNKYQNAFDRLLASLQIEVHSR